MSLRRAAFLQMGHSDLAHSVSRMQLLLTAGVVKPDRKCLQRACYILIGYRYSSGKQHYDVFLCMVLMLTKTRYALAEVVTALQAGGGRFQQAQAAKSPFSQLCTCSFMEQGSTFGLSMTRVPLHLHHNNIRLPARTGTHQTGQVSSLPSGKSMSLVSARFIATHIGQPRGRDHSVKLHRANKSTTPLPLSSLI